MTDVQVNPHKDDTGSRLQNAASQLTGKTTETVTYKGESEKEPKQNFCGGFHVGRVKLCAVSTGAQEQRHVRTNGQRTDVQTVSRTLAKKDFCYLVKGSSLQEILPVKQNPPLPPGVQLRPQGPPPASPRPPLNNYPPGAPRPGAPPPPPSQPLRRLDSRPSLGSPVGSTVLSQPGQLRPYGPPRPPGSPFPPRVPQSPNQNPQNQPLLNPQNSGPRFVQPQPGVRGPSPQIGPRPPFAGIQLPQQIQRADSEQRFSSQNGQQSQHIRNPNGVSNQSNQPRSGSDHGVPRQLQRNESTVNLSRQHSSNQDDRQSTKPRIVIENMTEVEKHCPENFGQKKRSEFRDNGDDDDDDVVVDTDKSPKHNGNTNLHNENLIDPSKSPSNKSADQIDSERPSTAKVESKTVDPHSRSITPSLDDKVKEMPSRPESSRSNRIDNLSLDNSIEESSEERPKQNEIKTPLRASLSPDVIIQRNSPSPAENAKLNDEQQKTPQKSPEISRSSTPGSVVVADSAKGQATSKSPILGKSAEHLSPNPSRPTSALGVCKSPKSPSTPEPQDKMLISNAMTPPRSPQESVKGFDNGQRRSLSSRSSPNTPSPQTPNPPNVPKSLPIEKMTVESEKKKATFADNEDGNAKIIGEETSQTSGSKRVAKHRAQTPNKQEIQNNSANKASHGNLPITNGVSSTPKKSSSREGDKKSTAGSPVKSPSKSAKSLPRTPDTPTSTTSQDKKKVPMNKIQVGAAPSPNLKTVRSKIGSLENASYKPGGGKVKIENRKLDFSKAQPKIAAKNEKYMPSGGDKKISQVKLQWNAKSKIGSLENATYKPGGGDKKIETVKLDFKDKAKPKVGSKDNAKHVPGGGAVKSSATPPKTPQDVHNDILSQKIDIKAESKVGSLDNVKHKPGGGDKKIFNDKDYLRQTNSNVESLSGSGSQSPVPSGAFNDGKNGLPTSDENLNQEC